MQLTTAHRFQFGGVPAKLPGISDKDVSGWVIVKAMLGYIWPKDEKGIKIRVLAAVGLLFGSKVSTICYGHMILNSGDIFIHCFH